MKRRGIVALGLFILLTQQVAFAVVGFEFQNVLQAVNYALMTGGGVLLVLAGFDSARSSSRLRWNHFAGAGLTLAGLGFAVSGLSDSGIGTESIDGIVVVSQAVGAAIVVWFGWQIAFDTRHVNFDWMNDAG